MIVSAMAFALISAAAGDPPTDLGVCGGPAYSTYTVMRIENPWTFDPGDRTIVAAPAAAILYAVAHGMRAEMGFGAGECKPYRSYNEIVSDGDVDSQERLSANVMAAAAASISELPVELVSFAEVWSNLGVLSGTTYIEAEAGTTSADIYWTNLFDPLLPGCLYSYSYNAWALASAYATTPMEWELGSATGPELCTFLPEVHLDLTTIIGPSTIMPDCTRGVPDGPPVIPVQVAWFSASLTITKDDTTMSTDVEQGVLAAWSDNTFTRLGAFADESFEPEEKGKSLVVDASVPLFVSADFKDAANVSYAMVQDTFSAFDGDLNRDGQFCWLDRCLIADMVGATLGTAEYDARADFDLDGTIETSDYDAFFALWDGAVIAETVCEADFNCDDVANSTDVSDFTSQWFDDQTNGTLQTDYDRNGTVNSTDISDFINNWYNGCP